MALDYYLKKFKEIYPKGPSLMEVFPLYQNALNGISEFKIDVACEEALRHCKFFPTPAEILSYVPDEFISTAVHYPDEPPTAEERAEFEKVMAELSKKLGVSKKIVREKIIEPFPRWTGENYEAMVGSQTLHHWATTQNLGDDLPRTPQEIELIKQIQGYGKKKQKRIA